MALFLAALAAVILCGCVLVLDRGPVELPDFPPEAADCNPCELRSLGNEVADPIRLSLLPDLPIVPPLLPGFGIPDPGAGIPDVGVLAADLGFVDEDEGVLRPEEILLLEP